MDKEQLFLDGINLMESCKQKFLKEKELVDDGYFVLFPKIERKRYDTKKFVFYVYKMGKEILPVSALIYNFEDFSFYRIDEYEKEFAPMITSAQKFNYLNQREIISKLASIFYLINNLKHFNKDSIDYAKMNKSIEELSTQYQELFINETLLNEDMFEESFENDINNKDIIHEHFEVDCGVTFIYEKMKYDDSINKKYSEICELIRNNIDKVDVLAKYLVDNRNITIQELKDIF